MIRSSQRLEENDADDDFEQQMTSTLPRTFLDGREILDVHGPLHVPPFVCCGSGALIGIRRARIMITAFFKPKSTGTKVSPDESTAKRPLDHQGGKDNNNNNNNNNNKRLKSASLDKNSDAVHELLSYLSDKDTARQGDETTTTWRDILQKHATTASSFARLAEFVASQR